ncbi:MAG: tRNA lysidine(34) synthetase TilS [Planctomycetes bacterium]|nr:tRNA lysidine(34) synthetase TilS [Planctomycetota bacterium]
MRRTERDPLVEAVAAACAGRRWRRGARVLVAVSGGADSVALLALLRDLNARDAHGWRITAAHLDHGLRGAAGRRDARFVRALCRRWGIPCRTEQVHLKRDLRGKGASMEVSAREVRYDFLRRCASATRSRLVATAHTLDDQAETVLFRVLKGTGLRGLRGILPVRRFGPRTKTVVVRPLLGVSRSSLREWLRRRGIEWREDASNLDLSRPRNLLRTRLLPKIRREVNPSVAAALARLASAARGTHRWMAVAAGRWKRRHAVTQVERRSRSSALLARDWRRCPDALRPEISRRIFEELGAKSHPVTTARLEAISRAASRLGPWPAVACPGSIRVRRVRDFLIFERVLQKKREFGR